MKIAISIAAILAVSQAASAQNLPPGMCLLNTGLGQPRVIPCYSLKYLNSVPVTLPARATPNWGRTQAQIRLTAPRVWSDNFGKNAYLDAMVTAMDGYMVARMSRELALEDFAGYTHLIMMHAGQKLTAKNLRKLSGAFVPATIAVALSYAPASIQAQYKALPAVAPLPLSQYWYSLGKGVGLLDPQSGYEYMYDLMLDSFTEGGKDAAHATQDASRYGTRHIKNVVWDAIVVASVLLAIYESPTVRSNSTIIWDWVNSTQSWNNTGGFFNGQIITYDGPGPNIQPIPIEEPPLPVMPPIEVNWPGWAPEHNTICNNWYSGSDPGCPGLPWVGP